MEQFVCEQGYVYEMKRLVESHLAPMNLNSASAQGIPDRI